MQVFQNALSTAFHHYDESSLAVHVSGERTIGGSSPWVVGDSIAAIDFTELDLNHCP
ncbi:hypothetical protein HUG10_07355 [Halorarum halophilum]|uniref:Uncharacterized protein n=1 Tax=Halorarum halophilum TaxID=2743090 RepID=A0A7D5K7H4_9EURY|nr:hypothetical protein [Halobaculum halophilum]QLG27374.1 hypothetical protein HUG10_07355 [Halobaculum halophilum]